MRISIIRRRNRRFTSSGSFIIGTSKREQLKALFIAAVAVGGIALHLILRFGCDASPQIAACPLWIVLIVGGSPLVVELAAKALRREFGSDLLAGLSIVTGTVLGEYLAAAIVVLMLSGGEALEAYAVRRASRVLEALAKRMPQVAHRRVGGTLLETDLESVVIGDLLVVLPHESCPVDGEVVEGHGSMDESYLTGEPYAMSKAPGAAVLSGAINGETALTIRATRRAADSRYAQIMRVMRESEQRRPQLRRLGDALGAWYTPAAVTLAAAAWLVSGDPVRFLAVLVVATPCPLLIAIPVVILGSISLAAQRGIVVKNPAVLEQIETCRTMILDKTGTLTYGEPRLTEVNVAAAWTEIEALRLTAALERYSKHPLARAIEAASRSRGIDVPEATEVAERPGDGLRGIVNGRRLRVTSRNAFTADGSVDAKSLPPPQPGLECVVMIDGRYAATFVFRDEPRREGARFIEHLAPRHAFRKLMIVSGDRRSEVEYLAEQVGIEELFAGQSPEQKVAIVRRETERARTVFIGDGINDAPALAAATVGIAFGRDNDVTGEAADVVVMDTSLERVDELLHIGRRMRRIALESAVGGMVVSVVGMFVAAAGYLPPVAGAVFQEVIDVIAVLNALRSAWPPRELSDFGPTELISPPRTERASERS
ncbi:MAG: cadmium-translocating P-type ATPase [Planctomycetaceae bacterium]|nr:cadmium-translocating P-type ATPase [Planctomycetaceae bacterium]